MPVSDFAAELLSRLERREAELLCWGVVDGAFTLDEVYAQIDDFLDQLPVSAASLPTADELLDELESSHLLWAIPPDKDRYRTRMAEGIRLLFRLRQILHWTPDWREASNLIADYRLLLRPRAYPRRHLTPEQVKTRLPEDGALTGLEEEVLSALLSLPNGATMKLADFQADATSRILEEVERGGRMSGTIVCAGTGSGKTMAFYLPALLSLARWSEDGEWTRCLALYPRNELLKDQLGTALRQVRKVNTQLKKEGRRPISLGALFGGVPKSSTAKLGEKSTKRWRRSPLGWRCPYLSCPSCLRAELDWREEDRNRLLERLVCAFCQDVVGPDELRLTRDSMIGSPPDLLFSSLEMLNQRMSDPRVGPLFGLGGQHRSRRPRLVLLDEVHTYDGVYGAQAALLLRRWKQASGAAPHFVGLSATLADAERFFAEFVDLAPKWVQEISPGPSDMEEQGQDYMLAMRGDPISDTNLLSASIQTAMLLRRLLDSTPDDGVYGTKLFGFTDDLDVHNRLYHDLLDAEGWRLQRGRLQPLGVNRFNGEVDETWLATYRATTRGDVELRRPEGQVWTICEDIGHRLTGVQPPVRVGRTSSQDAGVDADADIVVATASLEVGYDDDAVGAVLQHKAPLNDAAFLQRKGRAGRKREMRPWTVVMLSAYGRDRIAYEGYEQLFSPDLQPRHLPVNNRYVLRIQATYALIDWFERQGVDAHIWSLLSQPPTRNYSNWAGQRLDHVLDLVTQLLESEARRRELASYLRQALNVDDDTVQGLLWDPPRSLMMAVLPTLHRRLTRRWAVATPGNNERDRLELHAFWSPLPEFVPRALFADLNLPEVRIDLPDEERQEAMPILQALREFAPGRVTLRFGVESRFDRHWIPVQLGDQEQRIPVESICPREAQEDLGEWLIGESSGPRGIRAIRPHALRVEVPPNEVLNSSNSRPMWHSQLLASTEGRVVDLPVLSPWRRFLRCLRFFTHADAKPIEVRRFTSGANFVAKSRGGDPVEGTATFVDTNGEPVALGFSLDVDAVAVDLDVPANLHRELATKESRLLRGLRTARFRSLLLADRDLCQVTNVFQIRWLSRISMAALMLECTSRSGLTIQQALEQVVAANLNPLEEVLDVIFPAMGDADSGRMEELRSLLRHPMFLDALQRSAPCLWESPSEDWEPWLRRRFMATLAVGLKEAAQQLCPDLDADQLCVDIDAGPGLDGTPQPDAVWLSETTVGGGGFIEALLAAYAADPRRFLGLLDSALGPNDFEVIDRELSLILSWQEEENSQRGEDIRTAFESVRRAKSHDSLRQANQNLRDTLGQLGIRTSHPVLTALNARVLRPGSSGRTDGLLARLSWEWAELEVSLGVEIEPQVFAYLCSGRNDLDNALEGQALSSLGDHRRQWRFGTLHGLLWPRGHEVRAQGLQAWNPYDDLPEADRLLVQRVVGQHRTDVPAESPHWRKRLEAALLSDGVASVSAPLAEREQLARSIREIQLEPIDQGYLLATPRVTGVLQQESRLAVLLELAEMSQ